MTPLTRWQQFTLWLYQKWPMIYKIGVTLGALIVMILIASFCWHLFGRRTMQAQITKIGATWSRAPDDGPHPMIDKPLTPEQLETERRKLRETP